MSEERSRGEYVRKVQEGTRRYAHDLMNENERLRGLLAEAQTERDGFEERCKDLDRSSTDRDSLKALVGSLERDKVRLKEQLAASQDELTNHHVERQRLQRGLAKVEEENRRHAAQFSLVEQQNSDLANLYVASYRLLGSLDRQELMSVLQEIIANIIGCEEAGVFEPRPDGSLELVGAFGIDPALFAEIPMGEGLIGRCAASGEMYLADSEPGEGALKAEASLSACIPLKLAGSVSGVIALFRLLPQKAGVYQDLDRELFDLLATHAATALYCSALHAEKQRRASS